MILPSYLSSTLRPLKLMATDRLAVIGMVVLGAIIAMAIFAPALAPYDPRAVNEVEDASVLQRDANGVWRLQPSLGPLALHAADGDGDTGIAVGGGGTAFAYAQQAWRAIPLPGTADLNGVALSGAGAALAVGDAGTIALWDGADWTEIPAPAPANLQAVDFIDAETALIVGAGEEIWQLDIASGTITQIESPIGRGFALFAVARDSDGTMLAVGDRGLAIRYDPATGEARQERIGTNRALNGLSISAQGVGLAVGERATVLYRESADAAWTEENVPETRALRAGWVDDSGRAIAVGRSGMILERIDGTWVEKETESERHFRAVMAAGDTAMALGSDRFVNRLAPPSADHWFGTDHLGRDLFSQNLYGSQIALLVGFIGAVLVMLIGTNIGLIAGYYRGKVDTILMRTVDVIYGIPFEPFALILVLLFEPSLLIVILAVSLLTWRTVARMIRSQVLSLRERPFVKAARVAGASDLRIMYLHIFPNVMPLVFLELAIIVGVSIIAEATLSFLGLGPPQSISWGGILHNARLSGAWRTAWWWNLPPGFLIMTTVLAVFFISRSLEVIANPRLRARQ